MKHLIPVTLIVLGMAGSAAYADDIVHDDEKSLWLWSINGGAVGWGNLGNIKSMSGGSFNDVGFGDRSQYFLEAGAGWYNSDFAELSCLGVYYYYCGDLDVPFYSSTVGAYPGFRVGIGTTAFVGVRAHHADFGRVSGVDSVATNLTGPFYSLFVGAGF